MTGMTKEWAEAVVEAVGLGAKLPVSRDEDDRGTVLVVGPYTLWQDSEGRCHVDEAIPGFVDMVEHEDMCNDYPWHSLRALLLRELVTMLDDAIEAIEL